MQQVSISEFKQIVYHGAIRNKKPLFGWGESGVGKTASIAQVVQWLDAREIDVTIPAKAGQKAQTKKKRPGATLCDIRVSQYESVDFRGLPESENRMTVWNLPATLPFVGNPNFNSDPDHIIVLCLDEFTHGLENVMSVCYQLVNERRVGEHVLLPNVHIVALSNREGDKGISHRMPKPLDNRFTHVEVILSVDDFCAYAQSAGLHPMGPMFIQFRKQLLSTFMVDDGRGGTRPTDDHAYATPRSWETALQYYADPDMPVSVKQVLMAGAIGNGPASEFWGFEKAYASLSTLIPAIMKDPKKAPVPEPRDVTFAVTVALSGDMTAQNVDKIYTYLKRLDREFCMLAWVMALKREEMAAREQLLATSAYVEFCREYRDAH